MADGVRVRGELTTFDREGIDGSFGRREWTELHREDISRLHLRLMDQNAAATWINLGRILLLAEGGEKEAERAFARATRLDEHCEAAIIAAREYAAEAIRVRRELEAAIAREQLRTGNPEDGPWQAQPWPALDEAQQKSSLLAMKAESQKILQRAGMEIEPIETEFFLFYSDMDRRETAKWALELDKMYRRLANTFNRSPAENIFWGKAAIFVFKERSRFELVEADSFGQLAPRWSAGFCHSRGPQVFVSFFRQPEDLDFAAILVHESVHGFLHRYRSPQRLPAWANEGFADYVAATLFERSPVDSLRRPLALKFIRSGGDVSAILDLTYASDSWPGPESIGYAVGYLLVELMIRDRPRAFGAWVDAIKDGKQWEQALVEDFGTDRQRLVETFVRYYMVND
jgi:hypothetical protein